MEKVSKKCAECIAKDICSVNYCAFDAYEMVKERIAAQGGTQDATKASGESPAMQQLRAEIALLNASIKLSSGDLIVNKINVSERLRQLSASLKDNNEAIATSISTTRDEICPQCKKYALIYNGSYHYCSKCGYSSAHG